MDVQLCVTSRVSRAVNDVFSGTGRAGPTPRHDQNQTRCHCSVRVSKSLPRLVVAPVL